MNLKTAILNIVRWVFVAVCKINFRVKLKKPIGDKVKMQQNTVKEIQLHVISKEHSDELKQFIDITPDWAILPMDMRGDGQYV
jgi:hypothetical protein